MSSSIDMRNKAKNRYIELRLDPERKKGKSDKTLIGHDPALSIIKDEGLPYRFLIERVHHPYIDLRW